ncbi:MAG: FxLYD domain-containing protein [Anaerolineae bacterium]|jgi:LysM repeat protein
MGGVRTGEERFSGRRLDIALFPGLPLVGAVVLLAACFRVVTPTPTRQLAPVSTPTTTSATLVDQPTQAVSFLPPGDAATPTITPTPIVHVVQQGDTLHAIAFDFGVSVEALQAANGIEDPQLLQVGQRLVIPVNVGTNETTPALLLPTSTPQPVQVRGVAFYDTPVGSLWGLGEVANVADRTLTNVHVEVTLFNAAGDPVVETDAFVGADLLPPGLSSPFAVLLTTPPPAWTSYQVTVIRADEAGVLASAYVPIAVVDPQGRRSGSQFEVSGVVQNVSPSTSAKSVDVVVTTYDAQGAVTGYRQHTVGVDQGLAPGAETSFSLLLTAHGDTPDDFSVLALGRVAGLRISRD